MPSVLQTCDDNRNDLHGKRLAVMHAL